MNEYLESVKDAHRNQEDLLWFASGAFIGAGVAVVWIYGVWPLIQYVVCEA